MVELMTVHAEDDPFLYELYVTTRSEEIRQWGWDDQLTETFLRMQYQAQRSFYHANYPGAEHYIIHQAEKKLGRLLLSSTANEIRIVDISLLPAFQGQEIGSGLLKGLQEEAKAAAKAVRLQVRTANRARELYARLGFQKVREDEMYWEMEWVSGIKDEEEQSCQKAM
jgi:ribosomal protein S18 acetylase RimI-like enzyme